MSPTVLSFSAVVLAGLGLATWRAPRLTITLVWSLVVTLLVTSVIFIHLPMSITEKGNWVILLIPLIWVGCQFWAYWDERQWRVVAGLGLLSLVSTLIIVFSDPMG